MYVLYYSLCAGKLKSRRQSDAVEEIRRLVEKGYREVVLTGIHLGNYGKDLHDRTSLSTLVTELVRILIYSESGWDLSNRWNCLMN